MLEGLDDQRRRDVVREIRDELSRSGSQSAEIEPERVAEDQPNVLVLGKRRRQWFCESTVDLDGVHESDALERGSR